MWANVAGYRLFLPPLGHAFLHAAVRNTGS
ncbi:hypothetical protein D018_4779, partial [Vibrio parahaemolyticus VP2007-007]